jgi:hypothetical protein
VTNPDPVRRIAWKPIEEIRQTESLANGSFAALEALRVEWERYLQTLSEGDRTRIQQRTLRRLAIETGVIERLYEIDWGLTLTFVAEGFARDVIERKGGRIDDQTLLTLQAHRDSLEMVLDFVREDRELSIGFIKELHAAITRTQSTYTATDVLGRTFEAELPHGEWKKQPNHVLRSDNSLLEYAPPEHVAAEMDRLVALYQELECSAMHAIVKAAWLHHRFVQIHPFADGNGRVARALTLLVLVKHRFAPLVVDRFHREDYVQALEAANADDLIPLVKLFIRLESAALTSELERPEEQTSAGVALSVAHTLADQLARLKKVRESEIERAIRTRAIAVSGRIGQWFRSKALELKKVFNDKGLREVRVRDSVEMPPKSERANWFRRQVIDSAHIAGHYADFRVFSGWAGLRLTIGDTEVRYVASIHGAGAGVIAVTTFGVVGSVRTSDEESIEVSPEHIQTTKDAFRVVHSESTAAIDKRSSELEDLLDQGLAVALSEFMKRL